MFHTLAYAARNTGGATLADTPAVTDGSISIRSGHFIFTEQYCIDSIYLQGPSITVAQIFDSTYNAINVPQLYPPNLSATVPDNPTLIPYRHLPPAIPLNEEIQVQISNGGSTVDPELAVMFIFPAPGNVPPLPAPANPPGSMGRVTAIATFTTALTFGQWSTDATLTFTNLLKGGTYCINGAQVVCANGVAFRINFVRAPLYNGIRKLFPGGMCTAAYGNRPMKEGRTYWGPLGYFDTFELPYIEILGGVTTNSATYTVYFDLTYMGLNMLANQPYTGP